MVSMKTFLGEISILSTFTNSPSTHVIGLDQEQRSKENLRVMEDANVINIVAINQRLLV